MLSREARFFTTEGEKGFEDCKPESRFIVLTHAGSWKWATVVMQPVVDFYEITIQRGTDGPIVVLRATADHPWLLHHQARVTDLVVGDRLCRAPAQLRWEEGRWAEIPWEDDPDVVWALWRVLSIEAAGSGEGWGLEVEDVATFALTIGVSSG